MNNQLKSILIFIIACLTIVNYGCKSDTSVEDAKENVKEVTQEVKDEMTDVIETGKEVINETINETNSNRQVYNMTQVDTPALFDASCKTAKDPTKCSDEKLMAFVKKNAKFPKRANLNSKSLEQVLVVIEPDGSLSNTKFVASSKQKNCDECQQAAVDVVGLMNNWVPATKNGENVAMRLTIPIKYGR